MIKNIIRPREKDLGDFIVRRVLPDREQMMVGPWIFFDHMGPVDFSYGQGVNVRPHPHINLATVTYLFEGEIYHRDSLGNQQSIYPGDINLMVAGKGIVHSEREREKVKNSNHKLHGLQLWHALPEEHEETEPEFFHYSQSSMPQIIENDVSIRVMIGEAFGVISPVKTFCQTLYAEANIPENKVLYLPKVEEFALYLVSGKIKVGNQSINPYEMVIFEENTINDLVAEVDSQLVIIGGQKLGERYIEWNFVSSRKDRIEKAKSDWEQKKFPLIPGDDKEFIPLP